MNRIDHLFTTLQGRGEKALVGFVTAGDPSRGRSMRIVEAMQDGGLDLLELGIPFSDPTADGTAIQRSSQRALAAGASTGMVLDMLHALRSTCRLPVVLFGYYNPIFVYGVDRFCRDAAAAGADGLLVVDLPPEESGEIDAAAQNAGLALIRLVAPTTPPERMQHICAAAHGFIYLVSMAGVTGGGGLDTAPVGRQVQVLRGMTDLPICVGFGISTPSQAADTAAVADGVVVGSAFERLIEQHLNDPRLPDVLHRFVNALKAAVSESD